MLFRENKMSWSCRCGNTNATYCRAMFIRNSDGNREYIEMCDKCGDIGIPDFPDVYWDGKPEENLADDLMTGKPPVFLSKRHKARYLRERDICEAGDNVRGAPVSFSNRPKQLFTKEDLKMARAEVSKMGRDFKRQKLLKLIKETKQYEEGLTNVVRNRR